MHHRRTLVLAEMPDLKWARDGLLGDGEILGVLDDGLVAFWGKAERSAYVTGETVADIDLERIGVLERESLERDAYRLGLQDQLGMALGPAPGR